MKKYLDFKRETNPRANANFLSIITFFFTRQIFKKGVKRGIYERDVYDVLDCYKSENLGERMEQEWKKAKEKKLPIIVCLTKMFGLEYIAYGIIVFIVKTVLMVVKPLSVGKMISYFDPNKKEKMEKEEALFYAFIFLFSTFCWTLFLHNQIFYIHQFVLKIKIALSGLIYRKSLRLTSASTLKFTSGHAITLITKDILCFNAAPQFAHDLWIGIIHVGVMTYIIYLQIGVSAFAGVGFLVLLIPVQALLGKVAAKMRIKTAAMTDKRLKLTQEVLNAIKVVKVYTLENSFIKRLGEVRRKEITKLKHLFYIRFVALTIGNLCAKVSLCLCIVLYTALGKHINAEQAFVVWTSFGTLRAVLTIHLPMGFNVIADMMAAVKRITEFMNANEVSDFKTSSEKKEPLINLEKVSVDAGLEKIILKDITLRFKSGLNVVTGSVGSGKSFLLKMLLNEIPAKTGVVEVVGEVSYASQEPWLFPETIKQNIIFYKPYDADRYQEVIRVCALRKDISMLPERDSTFLIDKGLNISKGQQARVNLARAVYHDADIYLLDDSLSAVDAHVSGYIFEECIRKFLKDKICVFITQNHKYLNFAQQVIVLDDGKVEYAGSFEEMPKINLTISDSVDSQIDENIINDSDKTIELKKQDIKENEETYEDNALLKAFNSTEKIPTPSTNLYYELQAEGKVPWEIYKRYFLLGGGIPTFIVLFIVYSSAQVSMSWSDTFIRGWVDIEPKLAKLEASNLTNTTEFDELSHKHTYMLNEYIILIFAAVATNMAKLFIYFMYNANISRNLHNTIISKLLAAPMLFFDIHLSGSILNKFSRDLNIVDEMLPFHLLQCTRVALSLAGTAVVISTINWRLLLPSLVLCVSLYLMRILYLKAGRGVQRLEGATRNPVVGHVNASMEGLATIRSNKAQNFMKNVFDERLDIYNSATYMGLATSRALGLFADLTTFLFLVMVICYFFFIAKGEFAGNVGLAITQSFMLTGVLQWGICHWAELETKMTNVQRLLEYESVESEPNSENHPKEWPNKGKIEFRKVSLRYKADGNTVLDNVNFTIEPKQKIGIVGRTGAGKSSIIAVIFKLYEIEGQILIDDVDITNVSNDDVRNNISIIPQDPILFSGTLRDNVDPKGKSTDADIWDALEKVEMKATVSNFKNGIDTEIPEGGSNLSTGQRQLICFARAILKHNKILILDEATANMDPQTDALVQKIVKSRFEDCTVLTIAHRLSTVINGDKIMVVDNGRVIEYDDPNNLKANSDSLFHRMLKRAGLI